MLVYRVERRGRGPYCTGSSQNGISGASTPQHPLPCEDGINTSYRHERHGFDSLEKLLLWFDEQERKALHKAKFCVTILHCPEKHVALGRRQVVFNRKRAKIVLKMPIKAVSHLDIAR